MNKKTLSVSLIAFSLLIFVECNSEKKEQAMLFEKVMSIHDEVMPEMGKLRFLSSELSVLVDSVAMDILSDDSQKVFDMRDLSQNLKDANEGMMVWMRNFEQSEEGTPHKEVMKYLNEQLELIKTVKDDMISSKTKAEKYLMEN